MTAIKICGLKTQEAVQAAKGADYSGFVFFPPSPRYISPQEAGNLKQYASGKTVAVTVDANDSFLQDIVSEFMPDYIQLHGAETPEKVMQIKQRFSVPIIKAFSVKTEKDIEQSTLFEECVDMFLFDAKSSGIVPGGNGIAFDWHLLAGKRFKKPYFLSGGINITNVENALQISGAAMLDISSGVESSPGHKDPLMIQDFIAKVKMLG